MSCCVQAMARDVGAICTNAKLTYAREWQEAPNPQSPVYPRSALNDVLFKSEPLQAKSITNRRLHPPRLASPWEFQRKVYRELPPIPLRGRKLRPHQTHSLQRKMCYFQPGACWAKHSEPLLARFEDHACDQLPSWGSIQPNLEGPG